MLSFHEHFMSFLEPFRVLEGPAGEVTSKKRPDLDMRQACSRPLDNILIIILSLTHRITVSASGPLQLGSDS